MARIRSVKPGFWNDEKIGQEPETVMLTFIGLWTFSDDYAVVRANPLWLKNQIFPYKDKLRIDAFSGWLSRLVELEAVIPFTYRGESYYCIRTFRKHQKPDRPSKARNCPEVELMLIMKGLGYILNDEGEFIKHSMSTRRVIDEHSLLEEEEYREGEEEEDVEATHAHQKSGSLPNEPETPPPVAPPPSLPVGFFPDSSNLAMALPEMKIGIQIQRIRYTKKVDISEDQVKGMWEVFKSEHFTGKKNYKDTEDVYAHFGNWLKDQKFTNGQQSTTKGNPGNHGQSAGAIKLARSLADDCGYSSAGGIQNPKA